MEIDNYGVRFNYYGVYSYYFNAFPNYYIMISHCSGACLKCSRTFYDYSKVFSCRSEVILELFRVSFTTVFVRM